jgi:hypothetical protein
MRRPDVHESFGVAVGELAQEDGVEQAEDRRACAKTQASVSVQTITSPAVAGAV